VQAQRPATRQKIIELVRQWFPEQALPPPQAKKLSREQFLRFCLKEGGVARRVFELYAEAEGEASLDTDVLPIARAEKAPGGGDEFMAIKVGVHCGQSPCRIFGTHVLARLCSRGWALSWHRASRQR
jgi:hypothetical protein